MNSFKELPCFLRTFCIAFYLNFSTSNVLCETNSLSREPLVSTNGSKIIYVGTINKTGTRLLIDLIETKKYETIQITSGGGDIILAMQIGSSIFENKINVIVNQFCISACANYVFPAGKRKQIENASFVVWHGDARQRNFMQELSLLEQKENTSGIESLTDSELKKLNHRRETIKLQDEFYFKIGIDGSIARVGHGLKNLAKRSSQWLLPVSQMNDFGILNIDAPDDYASIEYCQKWSGKYFQKNPPSCLSLSNAEISEWKSRKTELHEK